MAALKAILADEQILFTEGISRILEGMDSPKVQVIATVTSGKDLLNFLEENDDIDLILFELNFTDLEYESMIKKIRSLRPGVKMFILSAYGDTKLVRSCFNCGIDGFALKTHSSETLRTGIMEVMQNRIFLAEGLQVAPQINDKDLNTPPASDLVVNDRFVLRQKLTKREVQILKLIISGMNNRQIAKELYISHETVGVHKKNIKKKYDVNSTPSLIHFVKENRIIE